MDTRHLDLPARYHDRLFAERLIEPLPAPRPPARPSLAAALCALPVSLGLLSMAVELFAPAAPI